MNRFKAAGIHLLLSCLIAAVAVCVMVFVWYPPPLFALLGGFGLLILISGCDVVIGPLLTLAVFKSGKKGLKFDLTVIGLLQLAALAYGVYIMAIARPAYIVFVNDRFELVSIADVVPAEWDKAQESRFKHAPWTGPEIIGAIPPVDRAEKENVELLNALGGGLQNLPRYYVAYERVVAEAAKHVQALKELGRLNTEKQATIDNELARSGLKEDQIGFLPVHHPRGTVTALVQRDSGKVLKLVDLKPDRS